MTGFHEPITVEVEGRRFCVQSAGPADGPPLLLIMGLGAQMTVWPDDLCLALAARGHRVIRYDNRDVGLSSKTPGPPPDLGALMARVLGGGAVGPDDVPYTLSHLAADAVGLLDALGLDRAHVVGASMGGMIAQHLAVEHPERLRSVTSIMSTTGHPGVGQPAPEAVATLLQPPATNRADAIEQGIRNSRAISGPLWNEADARRRAEATYDRMFHPVGTAFQLAAILASGDRTDRLRQVRLPFLVIHGRADALIDVSGGMATAEAVPGADLLLLNDMGHDLPRPLLPLIAATIDGFTERVNRA